MKKSACCALFPVLYALLAVLLAALAMQNGLWPSETNAMYPLYCGGLLYRSAGQGLGKILYDTAWFGGSETLRYFGPVPTCVLAVCQWLAGGDAISGAYLFLGLLFFTSACLWLAIGARCGRPFLGGILGIVWFFMPYHLHTLWVQGDVARSLIFCLLPLLFDHTRRYLQAPAWQKLPFFGLLFCLFFLTQPGGAVMAALAWSVLVLLHRFVFGTGRGIGALFLMELSGVLAAGLWLVPFCLSGAVRSDFSAAMQESFQPVAQSLNPVPYFENAHSAVYFGAALCVVCAACLLFAPKHRRAEAAAALVLLALSSEICYAAAQILPGAAFLRGVWLFSAAAALGLLAFLHWNTLKKPLAVLLVVLLALDAVPSAAMLLPPDGAVVPAEERMNEVYTATLREEAQQLTTQRLAILDEDALGAEGVYLASAWQNGVPILGGVNLRQSEIQENLTQLNRAVESGCYLYVFDRCLEMGCDTVLLQTALVKGEDQNAGAVQAAAARLGYALANDNGTYQLYHREAGSSWGVVSQYPAIGIGTTAGYTSLVYPAMQETGDPNLNHYTFEQLCGYELVLLSGFTCEDTRAAEDLVLRLSEAGVRVVIAADGIPLNRTSHMREFLGVVCNNIRFTNGYPELDTIDGILNTKLFPPDHAEWNCVYTEGLDNVWGSVLDNGLHLPFYGTVKNDNIVVVGLNLHYYYSLTQDEAVGALLSHGMQLPGSRLPERTLVPVQVEYGKNTITVQTDADGVNTGLSAKECFAGEELDFQNHFLMADHGTMVIRLRYPHVGAGAACSAAGILLMAAVVWYRKKLENRRKA